MYLVKKGTLGLILFKEIAILVMSKDRSAFDMAKILNREVKIVVMMKFSKYKLDEKLKNSVSCF